MAKKKMGGLGKGLDSLFADLSDDTGSEASGSTLLLREIEPDPEQPRKRFDDDALNQLADTSALPRPTTRCRPSGRPCRGPGHHQGCHR